MQAGGPKFSQPLRVLVTGLTLADPKDFSSDIDVTQSPDTVAIYYNVEPWSPRHLELLEKSLELVGQVGGDVVVAPAISGPLGGVGTSTWSR